MSLEILYNQANDMTKSEILQNLPLEDLQNLACTSKSSHAIVREARKESGITNEDLTIQHIFTKALPALQSQGLCLKAKTWKDLTLNELKKTVTWLKKTSIEDPTNPVYRAIKLAVWLAAAKLGNYDLIPSYLGKETLQVEERLLPSQEHYIKVRDSHEIKNILEASTPKSQQAAFIHSSEKLRNDKDIILLYIKKLIDNSPLMYEQYNECLHGLDLEDSERKRLLEEFRNRVQTENLPSLKSESIKFLLSLLENNEASQFFYSPECSQIGYVLHENLAFTGGVADAKEAVINAVAKNPYLLHKASQELKQDRDVVRAALMSPKPKDLPLRPRKGTMDSPYIKSPNYTPLAMADPSLHNDEEMIKLAIKRDGIGWFRFASEALKADKDCLKELFTEHPNTPFEEVREYFNNDLDLMRTIAANPEFLRHNFAALPKELQQDPAIYAIYKRVKKSWLQEGIEKMQVAVLAPAFDLKISPPNPMNQIIMD